MALETNITKSLSFISNSYLEMKSSLSECLSILQNGITSVLPATSNSHPPFYNDIGKKSRDLFNNGFYLGVLSLDVKTRSHNNVELSTSWTENMEESRLYGTVEAKYSLAQHNLALTEKINKNCFLTTELSYKSKSLDGLTFNFGGSFSPSSGLKTGLLKTEWSGPYCAVNSDLEMGKKFSFLTSSLVVGLQGILAGLQWKYDVQNDKQVDFRFVLGYNSSDFRVHTYLSNGKECGGAIYHKVAPDLEMGVDIKWWSKSPEPHYGVAGRYIMDRDVSIRGKISNSNEMGLSYEQKLSGGATLTISTLLDMRNFIVGKHKFGLGLHLEL